MAGFSVEDHREWRHAAPDDRSRAPDERPVDEQPTAPAADVAPDPETGARREIDARLGDLGFLTVPARLHDAAFGRFRRGGAYHALRFLLVVATVILVVGGVQADAPVVQEVGRFTAATPYTTLDAYPTPQFTYSYQIDVGQGQSPGPSAFFDVAHGTVRVPSFSGEESVYALYVTLLRVDDVEPVMLVKAPGGAYRTYQPTTDDGVRMTYEPVRLEERGSLGILLASVEGRGNVEVQLAVAEAPVETRELFPLARIGPIAGGTALGMMLLGAYAPGAALLRERRARLRGDVEATYAASQVAQPGPSEQGHARIDWARPGVRAWKRPGKQAAEQLAELPGPGWVIRLD